MYPEATTDFFPSVFREHYVRSGFYTSRPAEKRFDALCTSLLETSRHLHAQLAPTGSDLLQKITKLARAHAVHQHHDAMPGTDLEFGRFGHVSMRS